MTGLITRPCMCCGFPTSGKEQPDGAPWICSNCAMVALDRRYPDGSGPQDRMTEAQVDRIRERVRGLRADYVR